MSGLKKNLIDLDVCKKRDLVNCNDVEPSIIQQCEFIGLCRSTYYYKPRMMNEKELRIMNRIDQINTKYPFYGSRRICCLLNQEREEIGRDKVKSFMREMGLKSIYPKPNLSMPNKEHKIYPYLLKDLTVSHCNHVWSTDITYIKLKSGFLYLTAIIDWFSRYVISWKISNSLEVDFCIEALNEALSISTPEIFNTDQGVQYTSNKFTSILKDHSIKISMDGRGRALDNIFVERLWRSVKYEEVYIKDYLNGNEAYEGIKKYFEFYNTERPHQSLNYKTPESVYRDVCINKK